MRLSIRYQLLIPLAALMCGMAVISAWTAWSASDRARRQILSQLEHIAATLGRTTFPRNLQTLQLMKGLSGAEFLLSDHELSLHHEPDTLTTLPRTPGELPRVDTQTEPVRVNVGDEVYFCLAVRLQPDVLGDRMMYIFYPEATMHEATVEAARPAVVVGVVGGLISIALTLAATAHIARRIQLLERRTRLIAAGDFSPMRLSHRNDELRDLSQSINDMAQQLAQFQETIRTTERLRLLGQVSGGLAHQLRNGVTGARLALQIHAREHPELAGDEPVDCALRQLTLVEMQLKRFLDLGKAVDLNRRTIDLANLLDGTLALIRPQCRHAGIDLRYQAGPALPISGDPEQLEQLFLNVLTNAIETAGPGGWIAVGLTQRDGKARAEIVDSGPGPSAEVASRLFEPFVTSKPEGVGLGLGVARQIVLAHGGEIGWERMAEGTCFWIEVPV